MTRRSYELTCVVCGGPFTAAAANAKVCGDVCRRKRRAEQSQASYERTGRQRRRDRLAADPAARETNRNGVRRWRQANAEKAREQTRQAARRFRSSRGRRAMTWPVKPPIRSDQLPMQKITTWAGELDPLQAPGRAVAGVACPDGSTATTSPPGGRSRRPGGESSGRAALAAGERRQGPAANPPGGTEVSQQSGKHRRGWRAEQLGIRHRRRRCCRQPRGCYRRRWRAGPLEPRHGRRGSTRRLYPRSGPR
jgi:hypothetical protein